MNFLKHLKRPEVRASAKSGLEVSAAVPKSGLTFVDNSQGSSAAIAELSGLLDVAIGKLDFQGELTDQMQLQLRRLYKEAEKYSNSRLENGNPSENWNCSLHDAEIVSIAFACAAAVYDPEPKPSINGFTIDKLKVVTPSIGGTTKAASFAIVTRSSPPQTEKNALLPTLVVSVRGTASIVDRMVNLNGGFKDIGPFVGIENMQPSARKLLATVQAHAGFLNGAEALAATVSEQIKQINENVEKYGVKHILFAGHSAGGAVASLLFTKYLYSASEKYPKLRFSSVTFGAPPTTQPDLTSAILKAPELIPNRGLVLSIVNEYDLVPRADGAYVRSLVDLYRSIYALPPIQDNDIPTTPESTDFQLPRFSFDDKLQLIGRDSMAKDWPLPKPIYWHIGEIIVLKVKLADREEDYEGDDEIVLDAIRVTPESFARLLVCNIAVHRRLVYRERIDMFIKGHFNGKKGWNQLISGTKSIA